MTTRTTMILYNGLDKHVCKNMPVLTNYLVLFACFYLMSCMNLKNDLFLSFVFSSKSYSSLT